VPQETEDAPAPALEKRAREKPVLRETEDAPAPALEKRAREKPVPREKGDTREMVDTQVQVAAEVELAGL
jgi:hypothetical protein